MKLNSKMIAGGAVLMGTAALLYASLGSSPQDSKMLSAEEILRGSRRRRLGGMGKYFRFLKFWELHRYETDDYLIPVDNDAARQKDGRQFFAQDEDHANELRLAKNEVKERVSKPKVIVNHNSSTIFKWHQWKLEDVRIEVAKDKHGKKYARAYSKFGIIPSFLTIGGLVGSTCGLAHYIQQMSSLETGTDFGGLDEALKQLTTMDQVGFLACVILLMCALQCTAKLSMNNQWGLLGAIPVGTMMLGATTVGFIYSLEVVWTEAVSACVASWAVFACSIIMLGLFVNFVLRFYKAYKRGVMGICTSGSCLPKKRLI